MLEKELVGLMRGGGASVPLVQNGVGVGGGGSALLNSESSNIIIPKSIVH